MKILVRQTQESDIDEIIAISREVYSSSSSWTRAQLESHLRVFPEGQLVAVRQKDGRLVGMAASLIIDWKEYDRTDNWREFTDRGLFSNHDPEGTTLYGAEVMVQPGEQGEGVGSRIYAARRELVRTLKLRRIRAGSRLRGYHLYNNELSAKEYVRKVVRKEISDPTLTFQLRRGFRVLDVVAAYLPGDPESLGFAALIEWLNRDVATASDLAQAKNAARRFLAEGD